MLIHRSARPEVLRVLLLLFFVWPFGVVSTLPVAADELTGERSQGTTLNPLPGGERPALLTEAPRKARDLLKVLQERDGVPLPGYVGGRDFQNRERRLPRGRYREYDVNPKRPGRPRDAERIVIEQRTKKAYYTRDHYQTFVPLN